MTPTAIADPTDLAQLVDADLQADDEEEDDDAELGEDGRARADLDQAQCERPDDEPTNELPDDTGQTDTPEQLFAELRRHEEDEQPDERCRERLGP